MQDNTRQAAIDAHIQNDAFARFLGADVKIVAPGHSRVSLTVTEQMTNFHGITHGGLVFALGDLAFAAAGNSRGQVAVALNVNICFLNPSKVGDCLVAEARGVPSGGKNGSLRNHGGGGKDRRPHRPEPGSGISQEAVVYSAGRLVVPF